MYGRLINDCELELLRDIIVENKYYIGSGFKKFVFFLVCFDDIDLFNDDGENFLVCYIMKIFRLIFRIGDRRIKKVLVLKYCKFFLK